MERFNHFESVVCHSERLQCSWTHKMRGERLFQKTISEYKENHLPGSLRNNFKKHDFKFAWLDISISWLPYQATETNNASLETDHNKDGKQMKPILQRNDSVKKLITSKTKGIRRSLSENFKHRTIVKSGCNSNGAISEEIIEEGRLTVVYLNADEYIYRPYAPNTRRKAICDEIEKCIVQNGGTLRSLRRDLIVAVNLSNWHLLWEGAGGRRGSMWKRCK